MRLQSLITQAEKVFSAHPWYGKGVLELLKEVDPEAVRAVPTGHTHSIGQLVHHMIAWKQYLVEKGTGNTQYRIEMNSNEDWCPTEDLPPWPELLANLNATHKGFIDMLSSKDDAWLDSTVPPTKFTYEEIAQGIIHHDIYHLGQVAMMIKTHS